MKSCAVVPARPLSKVITTAPASPVPASNRSFEVSSVSRNWGEFGLKKLRGCDNGAVAEVDAIEITHRHHSSLGDCGRRGVIADNSKARRHFEDSSAQVRVGGGDRDLGAAMKSSGGPSRPAPASGAIVYFCGGDRLTGCLTADASPWWRTAGVSARRLTGDCGV